MILEFMKTRPTAKTPVRANPSDAGLDVFFSPEKENSENVTLRPGENKLFKTGLKFGVPHGYMLQVMNRSGMASKNSLIVGAHCIDSGYDGEVFIDLHNVGLRNIQVKPGDKIAQVVLVPVVNFRATEKKNGSLYEQGITISDRGDGALGSTDTPSQSTAPTNEASQDHWPEYLASWMPNGF